MEIRDLKAELNWVYGFRCQDIAHCIFFHQSSDEQNEKLLYLCSSVVVIFYYKLRVQRHYTDHENEVVSLCIGSVKDIVASGDKGPSSSIHIWDIHSTKSIKQLHSLNITCANLLKFINQDNSLIVVDRRHNSPVYIFDVESGQLITSCQANSFIFDIISIHNLQGYIPTHDANRGVSENQTSFFGKTAHVKEIGGKSRPSEIFNTGNFTNVHSLNSMTNNKKESNYFMSQQIGFKPQGSREMYGTGRLIKTSMKNSINNSHRFGSVQFNKIELENQGDDCFDSLLNPVPKRVDLLSIDISKNFFLLSQNCVFYFEFRGKNYLKKNIYYRNYIVSFASI
jgi:WD40 repeat protein